jgi:hypothetical protein
MLNVIMPSVFLVNAIMLGVVAPIHTQRNKARSVITTKRLYRKGAMTLSTVTFSISTLSIKGLIATLSIIDTKHDNIAECCVLYIVMLKAITISSVILSVIMLSAVAPIHTQVIWPEAQITSKKVL